MTTQQSNVQAAGDDVLSKLDYIVLIDHSGSMEEPSNRLKGSTRYQELQETATSIARKAQKFDDDGICVIPFNNSFSVFNGVTADKVKDVFKEKQPGGGTMLGPALAKAVELAKASAKETVVIVFTDGAAGDPDAVVSVLSEAGTSLGRPKIGFVFVQVGDDPNAAKFLDKLDNDLKVDVVATITEEQTENIGLSRARDARAYGLTPTGFAEGHGGTCLLASVAFGSSTWVRCWCLRRSLRGRLGWTCARTEMARQ